MMTVALGLFLLFSAPVVDDANEMFPILDGWELKVGDQVYTADNLWDIINGAADSYLAYDFQRLYTAEYLDGQDHQIRVYIYEHSNIKNSFGIYSQERNADYEFNTIGAQGFNGTHVSYFIDGPYYVQISTHNDDMQQVLEKLAILIDQQLHQESQLPRELSLFPEKDKVPFSEKFISNNFLGYDFMHSAFVADYKTAEGSFKIFIISPGTEQENQDILKKYLDFLKFPQEKRDQDVYMIEDPYNGPVALYPAQQHIYGIMGADETTRNRYLSLIIKQME
ncbi:hypothetical protein EH222_05375 [candidate division KSB1 bacterium]|nr:MAG: hypothetical protein EH222_05375 [candidate division KSB1 bacterium]